MGKSIDTAALPILAIGDDSGWIRRERLRALYRSTPLALGGSLVSCVAVVFVLWDVAPRGSLLTWFTILLSITVLRFGLALLFQRQAEGLNDPRPWEQRYLLGVLLAGLTWGSLSIWLFPVASAMHQSALALLLAGICAGAATVYAPMPAGFLLFAAPALAPFAARLAMAGAWEQQMLAGLVLLFIVILNRIAVTAGRDLQSLLELQVQNAQLTRALHHEATHDSLVDLANHGEFHRKLQRLAADSSGPHRDFAVIFIDLDLFKRVNDRGGHAAGDAMLREVATVLSSHARQSDTAARVGGDEFALLLENCPGEKALQIAEHIRCDIAALALRYEGREYRVGASIGVTYGQTGLQSAASVIKAADAACYAAKESGRNRVRMLPADEMFKTTGRFAFTDSLANSA